MLKMLMRRRKIPFTRWTEIRVYELHDKKMVDPHGLVLAFGVMTIPRLSDAKIIEAGLLSHNFCK